MTRTKMVLNGARLHTCTVVMISFLALVVSAGAQTATTNSPSTSASAQVPPVIQFSNVATSEAGNPLTGTVEITFSLYNNFEGGDPLWSETQNVTLDNTGHYSVYVGITKQNGVPMSLFTTGQAHWLGVQIAGQPEQPRVFIVSVPYAMKAGDAATVGGLPPSAFVMVNSPSGHSSSSKAEAGTGTQNYIPIFTDGSGDLGNSILYQSGTTEVGIGTTTPAATLEVNGTAKFDGLATFAAGQTFPGTLTGVTAGTGISVTGSKTDPTININTTFANEYYPQLAAANTFTKSQTVEGTVTATAFSGSGAAVTNVNAASLGGLTSAAFGQVAQSNTYQSSPLGTTIPQVLGPVSNATTSAGANSNPFDLATSVYNSTAGAAQKQTFRWQAEPVGNNSPTPAGTLNLLFGANGAPPNETGLSVANNGIITFATGQTFPGGGGGGTVTSVGSGLGLTGGPITTSGTLSINTAVVPQLGAANAFTGSQTVNGNITATGTGSGAGTVAGNIITAASGFDISYGGSTYPFAFGTPLIGSGLGNSFLGFAGNQTMTGAGNVGAGFNALLSNTSGSYNVGVGYSALTFNATASSNTALGVDALYENDQDAKSLGSNNTALGFGAAINNLDGYNNTATGYEALYGNTLGQDNTGTGVWALRSNYTGNLNTATGFQAGPIQGSTSLSNTTAIGANAYVVGSYATVIGASATASGAGSTALGYGAYAVANASNSTAVGDDSTVSEANAVALGTNEAGSPGVIWNNVGIGTDTPRSILDVDVKAPGLLGPTITLTNTGGGADAATSLDFNSYGPQSGTYNPAARIEAMDDGEFSDSILFESNVPGATNNGLQTNMLISSEGYVAIPGKYGPTEQLVVVQTSQEGSDGTIYGAVGGFGFNNPSGIGSIGIVAAGGEGTDGFAGDGISAQGGGSGSFAGNFTGDLNVTGALYAGTKDFKIDHPLDPANKYLFHASVESSEMMNIYTGNVTTDAEGLVTVQLPEWFEALNTDFRYQLTVIGQFAQAIVSSEISHHQFVIRTDKPNVKVSWQVTGVRQDAYAKAHPLVVEQAKDARERGHYTHPELYGASEQQSIEWARHPGMMEHIQKVRAQQLAAAQHPETTRAAAQPLAVPPTPQPRAMPALPAPPEPPVKPGLLQKQPAPPK